MRKKWDEQTKIQLGKLIHKQLEMNVKLNDAVNRAAEILQAPRSTCMNYWQKDLKELDYSQDIVTLQKINKKSDKLPLHHNRSQNMITHRASQERDQLLLTLMDRLRSTEDRVRQLYQQAGNLLQEYTALSKELAAAIETPEQEEARTDQILRSKHALAADQIAVGDIIRIHHHIWQDHYYVTWISEDQTVYGKKLNKNLRMRRKSKDKLISTEMLQFGKILQRDVSEEDVTAE